MTISPGIFFIFSKFWFSGFLGWVGVNEQKMVQNEKKFCLLHSISQESYTIPFPFIVHLGKIISPCFFYISSKFWFSGLLGRHKGKKQSKMRKKIPSVVLHISGTIHHMIFIYGTYIWNDDISRNFAHFFKILILHVVWRISGQK